MQGLTVGRNVHFVDGTVHKAAFVSNVINKDRGIVDLSVLTNKPDNPVKVVEGVPFSSDALPNTWHWIEQA